MEEIKDRLGEYKYQFFKDLQNYLDIELHFFGSIKRADFFKNASDVDIIVITDNVSSIMSKLQNYLQINKSSIQKIYQQHSVYDKGIITGYKIKYVDNERNIAFDLLIYDEKYRAPIMKNIADINFLPLYMVILLYMLKLLHYTLYLIPKTMYVYLKCFLFYCYFNKQLRYYKKEYAVVVMLDNM